MATARKFFIQLSSGDKFEIAELDFNNIKGRISRGASNGWYVQRGEAKGARHEWSVQFKDIAGFWSDTEPRLNKEIRNIDIEKRLPPEVGANDPPPAEKCGHDWNKPETWEYKKSVVNGIERFYKVCPECNAKSTIVKKREVEKILADQNKTLDDVVNL